MMSNSSQHSQGFNPSNNDELDQRNNNYRIDGPDFNEIKLTVNNDSNINNQTLQLHQQANAMNSQTINNNQSNSIISSNTQSTLCNSVTADNLTTTITTNDQQTSLPPAYWEVPGTVPLGAGSTNAPPPSYEDVINPNVEPPSYHSLFGQVQAARKNAKTLPDLIRKLIIILLGTIGLAILISFTVLIPMTMILVGGSNLDNCPAEKIPLFLLVGGIVWLTKNLSNFFTQCSNRRANRSNSSSANNSNSTNNSTNNSNPCASRYSTNPCTAESNPCASSSSTNCGNSTNRSSRCVINLDNEQAELQQNKNRRRDFLINLFITAWFLTGCIMVYRIYPPNFSNPSSANYCNKTVYFYAFWLLTSTFIIFAIFIGCICCVSLTAIFQSNSEIRI